jgi:hypothetical protein
VKKILGGIILSIPILITLMGFIAAMGWLFFIKFMVFISLMLGCMVLGAWLITDER